MRTRSFVQNLEVPNERRSTLTLTKIDLLSYVISNQSASFSLACRHMSDVCRVGEEKSRVFLWSFRSCLIMRREPMSVCRRDVLFDVFSLSLYVADVATDIAVTVQFHTEGHTTFFGVSLVQHSLYLSQGHMMRVHRQSSWLVKWGTLSSSSAHTSTGKVPHRCMPLYFNLFLHVFVVFLKAQTGAGV